MPDGLLQRLRESIETVRHTHLSTRHVIVGVMALLLFASAAMAYTEVEYDFEDGTTQGFSGGSEEVVQDSYYGTYSLEIDEGTSASRSINSTNASNVSVTGTWKTQTGSGLDLSGAGYKYEMALNSQLNGVYLYVGGETSSTSNTNFVQSNTWYRVWLRSNGTHTQLTLWEAANASNNITLTTAESATGEIDTVRVDSGGGGQVGTYDNISINTNIPGEPGGGETNASEALEIDTRDYIRPNESADYSVYYTANNETADVTDNSTLNSSNVSVLSVNSAEHILNAQGGVNTTVNVTAEYTASGGTVLNTTKQITVAQPTVENLEILPAIWRFGATIGDDTIFFLILATLTSIVATRLSTAFGGISGYWIVVMMGWLSGWLSLGILLVTTCMAIFIGLNLALTIDYGAAGRIRR